MQERGGRQCTAQLFTRRGKTEASSDTFEQGNTKTCFQETDLPADGGWCGIGLAGGGADRARLRDKQKIAATGGQETVIPLHGPLPRAS